MIRYAAILFALLVTPVAFAQTPPTGMYGLDLTQNNSQSVSAAGHFRFRFNNTSGLIEQSTVGAAYVGAISPVTIIVSQAGDLGVAINAADAQLGSASGIIQVPDGNRTISTQIHLHSNHALYFGSGTITNTTSVSTILYDSNTEIAGKGWGTIIREPTTSAEVVIRSYQNTLNNAFNGETGVYIHDFQIQGPYAANFDSASSTILIGNSHDVVISHVWLNTTSAIGMNIGGDSSLGFHATNVWIEKCLFISVASQAIGYVNGDGVHIINNTLRDAGQVGGPGAHYIDMEANVGTDLITDFDISGNIIDGHNAITAGNGILLQGGTAACGPGVISHNTMFGYNDHIVPVTSGAFANGIFSSGCTTLTITGNDIRRTGQACMDLTNLSNSNISGNNCINVGGGGIPAFALSNSQHNQVHGNSITWETTFQNCSVTMVENTGSDFNTYYDNYFSNQLGAGTGNPQGFFDVTGMGANSVAYNNYSAGRRTSYDGVWESSAAITAPGRALGLHDNVAFVDSTGGTVTLTLPDATEAAFATQVGLTGRRLTVRRTAGTNSVVLNTTGGQTIDGNASLTVLDNYAVILQSNGTNWITLRTSGSTTTTVTGVTSTTVTPSLSTLDLIKLNLQSATNVTTLTISPGNDGEDMTVQVIQPGAGSAASVPTTWVNVSFAGGTFTNTATLGRRDEVRLKYDATTSKWYETSRALNLTN